MEALWCCRQRQYVMTKAISVLDWTHHGADNGNLTEAELRTALVNGDWSPFDAHTVRMMIRMFDTDRSGSVNFEEFWYVICLSSLCKSLY